jgi:hypothetical protein
MKQVNIRELFNEIISGKKSINEIEKINISNNIAVKRVIEIHRLFLSNARKLYAIGEIKPFMVDNLIEEYNHFLQSDKDVLLYKKTMMTNHESLEIINHRIITFLDHFQNPIREKQKVLTRQLNTKGFVEPLLLGVTVALLGTAFLANLYLNI